MMTNEKPRCMCHEIPVTIFSVLVSLHSIPLRSPFSPFSFAVCAIQFVAVAVYPLPTFHYADLCICIHRMSLAKRHWNIFHVSFSQCVDKHYDTFNLHDVSTGSCLPLLTTPSWTLESFKLKLFFVDLYIFCVSAIFNGKREIRYSTTSMCGPWLLRQHSFWYFIGPMESNDIASVGI